MHGISEIVKLNQIQESNKALLKGLGIKTDQPLQKPVAVEPKK